MKKEYLAHIQIDPETLRKTKLSEGQVSESVREALANSCLPCRGIYGTVPPSDCITFMFEYVEGVDINKILSKIQENLALKLKLKPQEVILNTLKIKEIKK
jgi:hypothetical protein